ncbi:transmembrane protein 229B-like [Portunus trituberculatus]|uniref:transmembrane protein 229B-like n=1 Tax=Portunus trituberculatus TaxID=210409 RepID=UPI001E1CE565|nr:transmembrane protein 229B-like [Portunus trituberculatus]
MVSTPAYTRPQRSCSGSTSVWSLFIYGVGSLGVEQLYRRFHTSLPLLLRGLCYVAWIYAWEFSTERNYNLLGLITLEYFPAWYLASVLTEQFLIHNLLFLSLYSQDSHNRLHHKG